MILDDDFEITVFDPNYHEQDQMFDQKPEFSTIMGKLYKQRGTVFETLKKKVFKILHIWFVIILFPLVQTFRQNPESR